MRTNQSQDRGAAKASTLPSQLRGDRSELAAGFDFEIKVVAPIPQGA
jgi:hypothetical protein